MKIKHLIGINGILLLIIVVNFFKKDDKKYIFDRKFENKEIQEIKRVSFDKNIIFYTTSSDETIPIYRIVKDKVTCKIFNIDKALSLKQILEFDIKNSILHYISDEKILYSNDYKLFYNDNLVNFKGIRFRVFNSYPIDNRHLILLGIFGKNNGDKFGFFQYNLSNQELSPIHIISSEYNISDFPKLQLQYEGKFHKKDNNIVYINKKSSDVWVFDNWKLFKHFQTEDKTPLPQIIKQGDLFSYKRGQTYNVNTDFYLDNKYMYIFSCRNENRNQIVIDCYSFDGVYKNSFILPFNEFSQSLINVYKKDDLIVLSFIKKLIVYKEC